MQAALAFRPTQPKGAANHGELSAVFDCLVVVSSVCVLSVRKILRKSRKLFYLHFECHFLVHRDVMLCLPSRHHPTIALQQQQQEQQQEQQRPQQ